jgi:UDP-N-acetylmuramate dehydrogenase
MNFYKNISLKPYNTFGIDAPAKKLTTFHSLAELKEIFEVTDEKEPWMVLGGGSNILLTKPFNGVVLINRIPGITLINENDSHVWIQVGAGENWHEFVLYCVSNGWGGVENLSLIPGCVGASPMQNIGAYGVELKDVFDSLEAYSIAAKKVQIFLKEDCRFGYRESVFKHELKNKYIITNVTFKLNKKPVLNTSYGAINEELKAMGAKAPGLKEISEAVIRIRQNKLPDPALTGNAGSFFKNPEIDISQYLELKHKYPEIPGYFAAMGRTKVPAGWLIEKAGWKGYRQGDAGVHPKQALVLVNYGNASGQQIYSVSEKILVSVKEKFGILLEREVNIY